MQLSDYLNPRQIETLTQIGEFIIPGDGDLPGFREAGCVNAAVHVIGNLPEGDRRQLKGLLTLLSYLSETRLQKLLHRAAQDTPNPAMFDSKLQEVYGSLKSVVNIAYLAASPKVPEPMAEASAAAVESTSVDGRKRLGVIATLDTRGDEVSLVRELIESRGHEVVVVDMGVMGTPEGKADYSRADVASAGGRTIEDLIKDAKAGADRGKATNVMISGARKIVFGLVSEGKLDGIMGMGGGTAAMSASRVLKGLPVGMPKVLLTSMSNIASTGEEDITVMQSPVDLVGLNRLVRQSLSNAAGALVGMAEQPHLVTDDRPVVGLTALGVTTPAVMKVLAGLEKMGYEGIVFHALTDKLDEMVRTGLISAIIDMTTFEMLGKIFYSDEQIQNATGVDFVNRSRLKSAELLQIPQVIAPGGIDIHIVPGVRGPEMLPKDLQGRSYAMHGPDVMLVRTGKMENELVGLAMARRMERATAPSALLVPLRGYSDASRAGSPMHDPEADKAFLDSFKSYANGSEMLTEVDCAINDDAFAEAILKTVKDMLPITG